MKKKKLIEKQLRKKKNPELVKTIINAKKGSGWLEVAALISGSRRNKKSVNLQNLEKDMESGKILIVPGKVLSLGEISKKTKICALGFSEKAKEKILKSGSEASSILDEIKKNPSAKGIKIIK